MTEDQIKEKLASDKKRYCKKCRKDKPFSHFYIKKDKKHNKHWRFNSPCKQCCHERDSSTNRRSYQKGYQIEKKYSITYKEYLRMLKEQKGKCLICGNEYPRSLSVDHDHKTGEVRGLLCTNCNLGLGNFKDDTTLLSNASTYLKKSH